MHWWRAVPVLTCVLASLLDNTAANPVRTLERAPEELAWRTWLQPQQDKPQPRRPTKSLFVAPVNCQSGHSVDRNGCAKVVTLNEDANQNYLLERLNNKFGAPTDASKDVDYEYNTGESSMSDESGPIQFSIPLEIDDSVSDERNDNSNDDNKSDIKRTEVKPDLEAELALLKLQTAAKEGIKTNINDNPLFLLMDKPKRQSADDVATTEFTTTTEISSSTVPTTTEDNLSIETTYASSEEESLSTSTESYTTEATQQTEAFSTTTEASTTVISHHALVEEDDIKPELHGDSLNKALKLIGRYAEVTTDETYRQGDKYRPDPSTLGSRTKPEYYPWRLQHRSYESPRRMEPPLARQYEQYLYRYGEMPYRFPSGKRHLQDYWPPLRRHRHARRRADR